MKIKISLLILARTALLCAQNATPNSIEITSGSAAFEAVTNMPGVDVKGKSSSLSGRVEVSKETDGLALRAISATLPVKSLATGMKVRDEHMRKYIFTTTEGSEPDLQFTAAGAVCKPSGSAHDFTCRIDGTLSIRGTARPMALNLHVKEQAGSSLAFRAAGEGVVKLSDYGIDPPSQFGVKPANDVVFHLDFTGKEKVTTASAGSAR